MKLLLSVFEKYQKHEVYSIIKMTSNKKIESNYDLFDSFMLHMLNLGISLLSKLIVFQNKDNWYYYLHRVVLFANY